MGADSSRISSAERMQWLAGVAASRAERSEVLPAPGGPDTMRLRRDCITAQRKDIAAADNESRSGREARVSFRRVYLRRVAESRSATGGMAAERRAAPCNTRACTSGDLAARGAWGSRRQ